MERAEKQASKQFFTSGEVGKLLGCSSYWINILIKKGELDTHRIGGTGWHRVSLSSLLQYVDRHEIRLDLTLLE